MWKHEHFRDPAHKQRALELRNQGITTSPHASWGEAAKARRDAQREHVANVTCPFELYLLHAAETMRASAEDFAATYRITILQYVEGYNEIPF